MACYFTENVHTKSFTPREYQVELLDAARERNIIACLHSRSNKSFVALKLLQESANPIRKALEYGGKRSMYIGNKAFVNHYSELIQHLTDLKVGRYCTNAQPLDLKHFQVITVTAEVCLHWLKSGCLNWSDFNLLIIEDCHNTLRSHPLRDVVLSFQECRTTELPRILGLTTPLYSHGNVKPGAVEAQIKHLEKALLSQVETASDIVSILRYNAHPKEVLLECRTYEPCPLSETLANEIHSLLEFLEDHRYDPTEIYEDNFLDELKDIPDPKKDPFDILQDFLEVLNTMGPWCADKAALVLLVHIEKLKVKTPYERHFLLLCTVSSVLLKIRAICDDVFQGLSEIEKIYKYSSPKVIRLIEVVRQFKPSKTSAAISVDEPATLVKDEESKETTGSQGNICDNTLNDNFISTNCVVNDLNNSTTYCQKTIDNVSNIVKNKGSLNEDETAPLKNGYNCIKEQNGITNACFICGKVNCSGYPVNGISSDPSCDNIDNFCYNEGVCISSVVSSEYILNNDENNDRKSIITDNNHCDNEDVICNDKDEAINYKSIEIEGVDKVQEEEGPNGDGGKEQGDSTASNKEVVTWRGGGHKWRGRNKGWRHRKPGGGAQGGGRPARSQLSEEADSLCGIVFVEKRFTAKILYHLFHDLHKNDPDFINIATQYTVGKLADPATDPREAEIEHRKQEDVLKRFRMRECNLVVATSVLEEGIELPRCNLIVRYDPVVSFKSHACSKGRAKQQFSCYVTLVEHHLLNHFLTQYAQFIYTEKLLLMRNKREEGGSDEEREADAYTSCVPPYRPLEGGPSVDLSSSIALLNRYCAKLPSDTFTRLVPSWTVSDIMYNGQRMYYCTVRLPINSPLKQDIIGHPMPVGALARRMAALQTCRLLHRQAELDSGLEPIGKESFSLACSEELEEAGETNVTSPPIPWDPALPRPGTTKSRQYYYKRIASCLNECRPLADVECHLYNIDMRLTCPLPEEQNTRGRKLHPPELAPQAFGILTTKTIPKICPFPIFTRSGEVQVSLQLSSSNVVLTERHVETISAFLNFTFTSVLRLQKYLMSFDPNAKENSFFIVPTRRNCEGRSEVDWDFLEVIYARREEAPNLIPDEERSEFVFDPVQYADAVVMPWYRNQDQPQYFYVAEICHQLSPKSPFPGVHYNTFEDYYAKKYDIQIQNTSQPLLDVDHTSARLNFLTPRYVNRKGVALPTSSEETKRAKRENLEQKQILIGELCKVHVIPASLWRQAVCLPCILYRLNALLLADEIRTKVAQEAGLGLVHLPQDFEWAPLNFGWSLEDVLRKSREENEKKDETALKPKEAITDDDPTKEPEAEVEVEKEKVEEEEKASEEGKPKETDKEESGDKSKKEGESDKSELDSDDTEGEEEKEDKEEKDDWMEIGTWSNDMAQIAGDLPPELSMVRYGSPTSWEVGENPSFDYYSSDCGSDDDSSDDIFLGSEESDSSEDEGGTRLKITFRGDYLAEAIEEERGEPTKVKEDPSGEEDMWRWEAEDLIPPVLDSIGRELEIFVGETEKHASMIKTTNMLIRAEDPFIVEKSDSSAATSGEAVEPKQLGFTVEGYGMVDGLLPAAAPVATSQPPEEPTTVQVDQCQEDAVAGFSFDAQPELENHPGPSPSILLQALTMSNANDGINLERLETIGDTFLKYAITTYLYCTHEGIHEGKLSHLRSKQVSNLKLYRLGQKKVFGESMIASKFEPHDNWLPPCYLVPRDSEQQLLDSEPAASLPYNLVTQHSIPDKSIADCVEALIGAYLIECGPRGALLFMSWLGIKVLPKEEVKVTPEERKKRVVGSMYLDHDTQSLFTELPPPDSPLLYNVSDPPGQLDCLLSGFEALEASLQYRFRDRAYLLQAMSHASYSPNRVTDCYQRLEFLGDAVLDYLITRHLFEDKRSHSPGALTDLRSALVNNTIFASLAVKHGLHKFFRHLSPGLAEVVQRFVTIQEENSHAISEEYYLVGEEAEDVEVPKALGDVFESIAGAIFLDSSMSLDTVWRVYYRMMKKEIEQFSTKVPKSPIRELLELEPETAKFSKPEKLADGRRVRVTVEVFGKGTFKGIGRNYRIAKCTAAKCALKQLKIGLLARTLTHYPSQSLLKVLRACQDYKSKF